MLSVFLLQDAKLIQVINHKNHIAFRIWRTFFISNPENSDLTILASIFFATNYRGDRSFPETIPGACVINALNWKSGYRVEELIKKNPTKIDVNVYLLHEQNMLTVLIGLPCLYPGTERITLVTFHCFITFSCPRTWENVIDWNQITINDDVKKKIIPPCIFCPGKIRIGIFHP